MRLGTSSYRGGGLLCSCLILIGLGTSASLGDEPQPQPGSRLARLFRFGQGNSGSASNAPGHSHNHDVDSTPPGNSPATSSTTIAAPSTPASTPSLPASGPMPRISPQPRVSRPPTEADPIVTRIALGRSDNGGQFGIFLQIFADGTVIDLEGVHHIGGDLMRPLVESLRQGDIYRLKGHCGAPSTDFVEVAHVVVYERSYGKLRATSFSYSGNPQGCDASVRKLHAALDAIQTRLSTPGTSATPIASPVSVNPAPTRPAQVQGTPVLSLTPPAN
jgi:hypothetical protein